MGLVSDPGAERRTAPLWVMLLLVISYDESRYALGVASGRSFTRRPAILRKDVEYGVSAGDRSLCQRGAQARNRPAGGLEKRVQGGVAGR